MTRLRHALHFLLALGAVAAWGQLPRGAAYNGYVYPAGARPGSTVRVTIGGQGLPGVSGAHVSGEGVRVKIIEHVRPLTNKQQGEIGQHLRYYARLRWAETMSSVAGGSRRAEKVELPKEGLPELPDHPWVRGLDKMSLKQLDDLRQKLFDPKKQPNAQLGEWIIADITADPDATTGMRELRLSGPAGLTNPLRFVVSELPEVLETEPNSRTEPSPQPLTMPVTINGQIMPGDTDCFRLRARQGQKLVLRVQARRLTPYLADAVPGWFQAALTLLDAAGREVAFTDDYRNDPDPVLLYQVPQEGEYTVEIRDAIYRGREDFVYRLSVGELPFVTGFFPLGGPAGSPLNVTLTGWNLPATQATLDSSPGGEPLRPVSWRWAQGCSNTLTYAVADLPEALETEPNHDPKTAPVITLPRVLNGRLGKPGEVDLCRFDGQGGQEVALEVTARRVGSPLDGLLRLLDAQGKIVAWNDDTDDPAAGLVAHQADPYLRVKLPREGRYTVQLTDSQRHGGPEYAYRLRLSAPRPDFALRVAPSGLNLVAGRSAALTVHVLRQEGMAGEIEVALTGAPAGFVLTGGRIPPGRDRLQMVLTPPANGSAQPVALRLEGRARVGETTVVRPVVACEDMMQAFAYRHLVPTEALLVNLTGQRRPGPGIQLACEVPVKVPLGGTAPVQVHVAGGALLERVSLQLKEAPAGLSLGSVKLVPQGVQFGLTADAAKLKAGYADNLVVEVSVEVEGRQPDGKTARKFRVPLGVLPAIPIEVVAR